MNSFFKRTFVYGLSFLMLTPLIFDVGLFNHLLSTKFLFFIPVTGFLFLLTISFRSYADFFEVRRQPLFLSFSAFVLWVIITSIAGIDPLNSLFGNAIRPGGWFLLAHMVFFFLLLLCVQKKEDSDRLTKLFVYIGGLVSVYAILEDVKFVPVLGTNFLPRASSTIGNPIFLAGYLMLPFCVSIFYTINAKRNDAIKYGVISGLILLAIFSTGTRGALVGLLAWVFVGWVIWMFEKGKRKKRLSVSAGVVCVGLVLFFVVRGLGPTDSNFYRVTHFSDASVFDRLAYWNIAWKGFLERPVFGYGYENYYRAAEKFYIPDLYAGEGSFVDKPHNNFLEILVTSGIIGFGFYLSILFFAIRSMLHIRKQDRITRNKFIVLLGGFTAFQIQNLFVFDTITSLFAIVFFLSFILWLEKKDAVIPHEQQRFSWVSGCLLIVSLVMMICEILFFLAPTFHFFSLLQETKSDTNPQSILNTLLKSDDLYFVFDRPILAENFQNSAHAVSVMDHPDQEILDALLTRGILQFKTIVAEHPLRGEYWFQYAYTILLQDTIHHVAFSPEGQSALDRSSELMPNRIEPSLIQASLLLQKNHPEEGLSLLMRLRSLAPDSSKLLWTIAVAYQQLHKPDEAADFGYQAVKREIRLTDTNGYYWLANYYFDRGDLEKVIFIYKKAILQVPKSIEFRSHLAAVYVKNHQTAEAIKTAKEIIQIDPMQKETAQSFIDEISQK